MNSGQRVTCPSTPTLVIENGPQAGRSLALQSGAMSVGKSLENDIIIVDNTLSDVHFKIQQKLLGVEISALHGPLTLANGKHITSPRRKNFYQNFMFVAGSTKFCVVFPQKKHALRLFLLIFLFLILGMACFKYMHAFTHAKAGLYPIAARTTQQTEPDNNLLILKSLQNKLAEQNFTNITISDSPDGALVANGYAEPEQKKDWSTIKLWFDNTYGSKALLLDHVAFTHATVHSPIQISGVALGALPYVIDTSGQRLPPGSLVEGGWVIEKILVDRIILHRGMDFLTVRF